jgi:hypothetical protein
LSTSFAKLIQALYTLKAKIEYKFGKESIKLMTVQIKAKKALTNAYAKVKQ